MTATTNGADIVPIERVNRGGRPRKTDRTQLVAAARAYGFQGLTVGVVTAACGVRYSTFYRSLPDVETLRAALVDDVLSDVPIPTRDTWRAQLDATAATIAATLHAWPGMGAALAGLAQRPAWLEQARQRCFDAMTAAGFTDDEITEHDVDVVLALAALDPRQINADQAGHDPAAVTAWAVGLVLNGIAAEVGER